MNRHLRSLKSLVLSMIVVVAVGACEPVELCCHAVKRTTVESSVSSSPEDDENISSWLELDELTQE